MIERLAPPPANGMDFHYRNSQQRRREETVAIYLQRYCAKNETIGFFGPAGWGKFVPHGEPITVDPGRRSAPSPGLISAWAATTSQEAAFPRWLGQSSWPCS